MGPSLKDMHHTVGGGNTAPSGDAGLDSAADQSDQEDAMDTLLFDPGVEFPRPKAAYHRPSPTPSLLHSSPIPSVEAQYTPAPCRKKLVEYDSEADELVSLSLPNLLSRTLLMLAHYSSRRRLAPLPPEQDRNSRYLISFL